MPEIGETRVTFIPGGNYTDMGDGMWGNGAYYNFFEWKQWTNDRIGWGHIGEIPRATASKMARALQRYAVEHGFEEGEANNDLSATQVDPGPFDAASDCDCDECQGFSDDF